MTRWRQWEARPMPDPNPWVAWFDGIGVDPADVAVPGWVLVDDTDRTVTFLGNLRDEHGRLMVEGNAVVKRPMRALPVAPVPPFPTPFPDLNSDDVVPYTRTTTTTATATEEL